MNDDLTDGALIDVCDLTLGDLRELSIASDANDASGVTCIDRALARILSDNEADGYHGFQSSI